MAIFAERISIKVKIKFFEKCIEKDSEYYDKNNPTEMATRIANESSAI